MVIAERGKKSKVAVDLQDSSSDDHIDAHLVLSIEKLQELQDQLEKVPLFFPFTNLWSLSKINIIMWWFGFIYFYYNILLLCLFLLE